MSKSSPLTEEQKAKDKAEAHGNPSLVHARRGSEILSRAARRAGRKL